MGYARGQLLLAGHSPEAIARMGARDLCDVLDALLLHPDHLRLMTNLAQLDHPPVALRDTWGAGPQPGDLPPGRLLPMPPSAGRHAPKRPREVQPE